MLNSLWITVPVAIVLGFLSGLGTGGGSLLILWLTMALHTDPVTARCINLMFFIPSALVACLFRWKNGSFRLQRVLPAIAAGCVAAFLGAMLSTGLDISFLRRIFGGLLIVTGLRELMYKPKAGH